MSRLTRALVDAATSPFLRTATVADVVEVGTEFRRIGLRGDGLVGASWKPGHKVQIRFGDGLTLRTYTPIRWDAESGATSIIAFLHGGGPGSTALARIEIGESLQLFGPRPSLRLEDIAGPALFVGDETSIGLAVNRHEQSGQSDQTVWIFEAADPTAYRDVLAGLGIDATVVPTAGSAPHDALRDSVLAAVAHAPSDPLIITGRAQTISALRSAIKTAGLGGQPTTVKAYWDERRTGLD